MTPAEAIGRRCRLGGREWAVIGARAAPDGKGLALDLRDGEAIVDGVGEAEVEWLPAAPAGGGS